MSSPSERRNIGRAAVVAFVWIVLFLAVVVMIGRLPVRGSIAVSQNRSDRFSEIMKDNGIIFWTGIGGMGMMGVQFDNPFTLTAVDDLILEDARKNKYKAVIRYECIITYFDHQVIVN